MRYAEEVGAGRATLAWWKWRRRCPRSGYAAEGWSPSVTARRTLAARRCCPQPTVWLHVAADPSGTVHIAGSTVDGETLRLWVARLSPDGDEQWRTELDAIPGASASDTAGGLVLSSAGTLGEPPENQIEGCVGVRGHACACNNLRADDGRG